jgi:hypothetical protein
MAMRDEDVGDALDGLIPVPLEGRIIGEEGVDQDHLVGEVEAKCTVSEPSDLHGIAPSEFMSARPVIALTPSIIDEGHVHGGVRGNSRAFGDSIA